MKKRIIALLCILLFACGMPQTEIPEAASLSDAEPSAETAVKTEPASLTQPDTVTQPDNILEFLDGTWNLRTNQTKTDRSTVLEFSAASGTVRILTQDTLSVAADLNVFDTDPDSGITGDAIRFSVTEAADDLIQTYGTNLNIYSSDMQYFAGTFEGTDYLFLRELGNGLSVIDLAVLKEENETGEHGWIFTRAESPFAYSDDDESLKSGTYYAFCWMKDDSGFLLQNVDVTEQTADWYGEEMNILRVTPSLDHRKLFLGSTDTVPKVFSPGLYCVTADSEGTVTQAEPVEYIGYGAYRLPG